MAETPSVSYTESVDTSTMDEEKNRKPPRNKPNFYMEQSQIEDFLKAFIILDTAEVGYLSLSEVRVAFRALGYEPTKIELEKISDENNFRKTRRIAFDDFVNILTKKMLDKDSEEDLTKAFRMITKGNKHITFSMMSDMLKQLGSTLNEEEMREMFDAADKNGDGFVDLQEFVEFETQMMLGDEEQD